MSKFSPICISDTDESDTEETKAVVLLISDEEDTEINDLPQAGFDNDSDSDSLANLLNNSVIIKSEPVCSSEKPTASPKTPITLNINRLKWLSCQIKLSSGCDPTEHGHAGSSVGKQSVVKKEDCDLDKADDLYKDNSEKVYKYKQNAPSPTMEKDTPSPVKGKNQISSPKLLKSQAKNFSASFPLKYDKEIMPLSLEILFQRNP
ncbi:hypothetical protein QZH41_016323 [Actinostola sp. cb2023]|nr:hypothetical protein QZH41_016323 [Actinostola sp. cb2023]